MNNEIKYLTKFLDNNKMDKPLDKFVNLIQGFYYPSYRHAHPYVLQWNITPKCNLRCKHCYYAENPDIYLNSKEPSLKRKLEIVDEIEDLNIFNVIISGGEALISDGIFDIISKLKSKNISLYIHSNGIAINKKIALELAKILVPEMDSVQISLDGLEEAHNATRGEGAFNKAIDAIKNLKDVGIPVCVNYTVTKQNINDVVSAYNLVSDLGVKKFSLLKLIPCSDFQQSVIPDFEELLQVSCNLIDKENSKTFVELVTFKLDEFIQRNLATDYLLNRSKEANDIIKNSSICCHRHGQLFITFEGDVFACREAYVCKELSLGNIKENSLSEIWQNRFCNELFKERYPSELKSENCPFIGICNAWCPLKAYIKTKDINSTCSLCKSLRAKAVI